MGLKGCSNYSRDAPRYVSSLEKRTVGDLSKDLFLRKVGLKELPGVADSIRRTAGLRLLRATARPTRTDAKFEKLLTSVSSDAYSFFGPLLLFSSFRQGLFCMPSPPLAND